MTPNVMRSVMLGCVVLASTLLLNAAADPAEGRWLGHAGPADNPAVFGLEIKHDAGGTLVADLYFDVLNFHGLRLPTFNADGKGKYVQPEVGVTLTLQGDKLVGMIIGSVPIELHRTDRLPGEPPIPADLPSGPEPRWRMKLGSAIWARAAVRDGTAYVGTQGGAFHAVDLANGNIKWVFTPGRPIFGGAFVTATAVYFVCDNGTL